MIFSEAKLAVLKMAAIAMLVLIVILGVSTWLLYSSNQDLKEAATILEGKYSQMSSAATNCSNSVKSLKSKQRTRDAEVNEVNEATAEAVKAYETVAAELLMAKAEGTECQQAETVVNRYLNSLMKP